MPDARLRNSDSPLRKLGDATIVGTFSLLVLLPWESWLGSRPSLSRMNEGLSWQHPLGFDSLGRDLVVRIAGALRGAVLPLWSAVCLGALLGACVALLASMSSRQRFIALFDTSMAAVCSLPVGIVAFAWAAFREQAGLAAVGASLAPLAGALCYLRVRDLLRRDAKLGYWEAHRAAGGAPIDRLLRYGALGSWRIPLLLLLSFLLRASIAIEASLSYLGFGVVEPQPSLGNILAAHFELYLRGDWRVLAVVAATLALAAALPAAAVASLERLAQLAAAMNIPPRVRDRRHAPRGGADARMIPQECPTSSAAQSCAIKDS